jgi:hypothetical protein
VDKYWNKERLKAHAAPHLEFNPEKKPWVGLTDDEMNQCSYDAEGFMIEREVAMRAVEALLKEKNT